MRCLLGATSLANGGNSHRSGNPPTSDSDAPAHHLPLAGRGEHRGLPGEVRNENILRTENKGGTTDSWALWRRPGWRNRGIGDYRMAQAMALKLVAKEDG